MKILAINGTYRKNRTTTELTAQALEGAASVGAETEMVLLAGRKIQHCRNCLACYDNLEAEVAPCPIRDDMDEILGKIREADGVIFSSPVHSGFVSGLMVLFFERAVWRLCRPTGRMPGVPMATPAPRLTSKPRAAASIVSAGGMPPKLRRFCDNGTPWLRSNGRMLVNGTWVGDMYAGAIFTRGLRVEERSRAFFFRELADEQRAEARALGRKMAEAIREGRVHPYRFADEFGSPWSIPLGILEQGIALWEKGKPW